MFYIKLIVVQDKVTFWIFFKYETWAILIFVLIKFNIYYKFIYIILINYFLYIHVYYVLQVYQTSY